MSSLPATRDDRAIWDNWLSMYQFPIVTVADTIGLFAAISSHALTTGEVAAQLDVDARALGIHLGLLAALGFVEKREARWRATAVTRTWLHPDAEGYYGPLIHQYRERQPLHAQLLPRCAPATRQRGTVPPSTNGNVAKCRRTWRPGSPPS